MSVRKWPALKALSKFLACPGDGPPRGASMAIKRIRAGSCYWIHAGHISFVCGYTPYLRNRAHLVAAARLERGCSGFLKSDRQAERRRRAARLRRPLLLPTDSGEAWCTVFRRAKG